jgi:hypothetical protein
MAKQKVNPISIPTLCDLYKKDPSQLRKMIDKLGINKIVVKRPEDNKVVTAITDEDHQRLVDTYPNLTADKATKQDVSISEACKLLGYKEDQISNFTRACSNSWGIEIYEKKFNGRTQKCISKKDFNKAKSFRILVTTEVD